MPFHLQDWFFQPIPPELLQDVELAATENRLSWRVTDLYGYPANGGTADPLPLGKWSPEIANPEICVRGWHTTTQPHRWKGCRVWLVEGDKLADRKDDKSCWNRIRPLAEVDPDKCTDPQVFVRCRANLSGAKLSGAYLYGAYLFGVNLSGAKLSGADLSGANLSGADLSETNLTGANLYGTNLTRANLSGAKLSGAKLSGAYLSGADLFGADLAGADL